MKRNPDYLSAIILVIWAVTLVLLCLQGLRSAGAQDTPETSPSVFTLSCYITDEGYATVLVNAAGRGRYTFDNVDGIDTTIPKVFVTHAGVYRLGRISIYGEYSLSFVRSDGLTATLAMTPDWQTWCDKVNTPPESAPEPTSTPLPMEVPEPTAVPQVMSTGITCTVQYPKIILVCNGA